MRIFVLFAALVIGSTTSVHAMSVSRVTWNGHDAILASGTIQNGDAQKISDALMSHPLADHGAKILLLDSPGGSVDEAFEIANVLDSDVVHTVVPEESVCASACASILFIAAEYHTIQEGGRIGQHSCSVDGKTSQECNNDIAQHAVTRGVAYGSIAAFMNYTGPENMAWFDRELADCWGLTRYPFSEESGYEESTPCVINQLSGSFPKPQAAWRVNFIQDGFKAFVRGVSDHQRVGQVDLFCDETYRGRLFLRMHIPGQSDEVSEMIDFAALRALPTIERATMHRVLPTERNFSLVEVSIPRAEVKSFLTEANDFTFYLEPTTGFDPIYVHSYLAESRPALIFAANNCTEW